MSDGKSIIVDTTRCTACRGCQVACKQWNGLPATKTRQTGTYQNPADLSFETYKLVRFAEGLKEDKKPFWYFFSEQCRHCVQPPCFLQADKPGGLLHDEKTGAVYFGDKSNELKYKDILDACPYNIPRQNEKTKGISKCSMCFDRITNNMVPACVLSCPTGAMVFGERDEILKQVQARVAELKKTYPLAQAIDAADVRVIYIVTDDPKKYYKHAAA